MLDVNIIAQQHYGIMFKDRFDDTTDTEAKECECGRKIDEYEKMCDVCKNDLKKQFSTLLHDNFTTEEIEILNELYDGEEIK